MKEIFKPALSMFGKQIIVNIMNVFMVLSFMVLMTGLFTSTDGFKAEVYEKDGKEPVAEFIHKNSDGEDKELNKKLEDYDKQGYIVKKIDTRDTLSKGEETAFYIIVQVVAIMLVAGFVYPACWDIGAKDSNLVKFKHKSENKLRGLEIGLVAMVPFFILMLVILTAGRNVFNIPLLSVFFANFYSLIRAIGGTAYMVKDLAVWQSILMFVPLLIVPFFAWIGYYLGYKDISLSEKIIYKNNKNKKVGE